MIVMTYENVKLEDIYLMVDCYNLIVANATPRMKTNSPKLLAVRLDRLIGLQKVPCRSKHLLYSCRARKSGVMLAEKFHSRLPVVAGKGVFLDESFAVVPLPAVQSFCYFSYRSSCLLE